MVLIIRNPPRPQDQAEKETAEHAVAAGLKAVVSALVRRFFGEMAERLKALPC